MVSIKIDLKKKDFIWISLVIVLIGVGFVISLDSDNYLVHGHDAGELDVSGGGGSLAFGDWVDMGASSSVHTASTDGIVIAYTPSVGGGIYDIYGYTPDNTLRIQQKTGAVYSENPSQHITMPVKKGDTWKVTGKIDQIWWIPIESIGGSGGSILTSYTKTCTTNGCTATCDSGDVRGGCGLNSGGGAHNNDLDTAYPTGTNACTCDVYNNRGTCYAICLDTA